jgi:hypothetical protein
MPHKEEHRKRSWTRYFIVKSESRSSAAVKTCSPVPFTLVLKTTTPNGGFHHSALEFRVINCDEVSTNFISFNWGGW